MKAKLKLHLLFLALAAVSVFPSPAADIASGTNAIHGHVRLVNIHPDILARLGSPGEEGMTQMVIYAYTDLPSPLAATKSIYSSDRLAQPYDLTVSADNIPLTYHAYADVVFDGLAEEYWTDIGTTAPVTSNSAPATLDFDECIALVELRYVDALGQPVEVDGARVQVLETGTSRMRARINSQPPGRTNNFLVVPSAVEIQLAVEVDTGTDLYLDRFTHTERHTMTLACEDQPVLTITLPSTAALGRIVGQANLVDEIEPATEGYLELLGRPVIKALGPSLNQRYAALEGDPVPLDASRPFALEGLVPSTSTERWNVFAELHFGEGYRFEFYRTPGLGDGVFNPGAEVTGGGTLDLGNTFVMRPARLVGRITLEGPPEMIGAASGLRGLVRAADYDTDSDGIPDGVGVAGIGGSYAIATGVDELAPGATLTAAGGSATASFAGGFNPATSAFEGDYETVVGMLNDQPGVWKYDGLSLVFQHPGTNGAPYVNESLYIIEDAPWQGVLAPGDRVTNDVRYGMAEVCLRIRAATPFFYPRIASTSGGLMGFDSMGQLRSYRVGIGVAASPPYTAAEAVFEAVVTYYVPEGTYTIQPAISIPAPDGTVSETQLPTVEFTVTAGERYCVEDCLRIIFTGPNCTTNFGFLTWADAYSCEATLTNLSLTTRPLGRPDIRLGYSDIRILEPFGVARTTLRTGHGLFPEFDDFLPDHPEYYSNMVVTAVARDNRGRIATRQMITHYDFTPPTLNCPGDIAVTTPDGSSVPVDFTVTATDNNPEPLRSLVCVPPSGSIFPLGTTLVTCTAVDLCRNTNTCSFNVIVQPPACALSLELLATGAPDVRLTWDCPGLLECAPAVNGPWDDVPGATNPHTMPVTPEKKFFRVRRQ